MAWRLARKSPLRATARPSSFANAASPWLQHPPVPTNLKGPRRLMQGSRRPRSRLHDGLVPAEPPAPTPSAPRPNPGGCGFAQARRLVDCCVARYVRSFTAALPLSRRARRASLGQHYGPIGLVCEPDDAPSRGTRGLVLGSPETSSRKSSFGSCGDYKGSPPFPPWRCRADCRAGMALLVSWAAATIMSRGSAARKLLYLPCKWVEVDSECKILTQVSTLSHLNINFRLSNIWHIIYQNVGNFLSFLKYLIRIGLRSYLGGVFS